MEFLIRALDGQPGALRSPDLPPLPATADPALVQEAVAFLRRSSLSLEPRKQWPTGGLPQLQLSGRIPTEQQAQPGKALCIWGDAGWGDVVRRGKYRDDRFADELVDACAALVHAWVPQPSPAWVTCVPSRRRPDLVPDFARRLASALTLRFRAVLERTADRPEQKLMANSTQQARNIDGSLGVRAELVLREPVFLVDDIVDSRWTLTVAAALLRSNGSGEVFPLVLALAGKDD
jgi:ATP-dependent DNA helicase RecQ